jgi:glycosyltransferase involved in cell wall biosynthesis
MIFLVLICAGVPAALFCWNLLLYEQPPKTFGETLEPISVLIPARNEELSIGAAVASVLASQGVEFELIVLDDDSMDRTAEIVLQTAQHDARLRLERAPALPARWNGKQHACFVLAKLARHRTLCFLDADVRVDARTLARMAAFLRQSGAALVSGFPRQETGTWLEALLLPLIHFVLLAYLPIAGMRRNATSGSFAAGCGQFMMMRSDAYWRCGGHGEIRSTMHDGLLLPRLFRDHGFATDLADLTQLATCRMYHSAGEVWQGLSKNATEGMAATARIVPFSFLLLFGQVLPFVLLLFARFTEQRVLLLAAVCAAYTPRLLAAARFQQSWLSAVLHPVGVLVMLVLEWNAWFRKITGHKFAWKNRAYDAG